MSLLTKLAKIVTHKAKRLGRGHGSGKGAHTVGRGTKGHTSREGGTTPLWFEGGQLPLIKRLPMQRGKARFQSLKIVQTIPLATIVKKGLTEVTPETLRQAKLTRQNKGIPRIISGIEITTKITVSGGVEVSAPVRTAIEKAGGSVTV